MPTTSPALPADINYLRLEKSFIGFQKRFMPTTSPALPADSYLYLEKRFLLHFQKIFMITSALPIATYIFLKVS